MPPLRCRDHRASSESPLIQRRLARGLSVDVSLANQVRYDKLQMVQTGADELEIALAAKEVELATLLSPTPEQANPWKKSIPGHEHSLSCFFFPQIVDSQTSFLQMRTHFTAYLDQMNLTHLVSQSGVNNSFYLPYG
jgi:hypothetical protein